MRVGPTRLAEGEEAVERPTGVEDLERGLDLLLQHAQQHGCRLYAHAGAMVWKFFVQVVTLVPAAVVADYVPWVEPVEVARQH